MTFPTLLDGVVLFVFFGHNLVQVDFVVQKLVELKAFKRFEHLFNLFLNDFDESFVLNFEL